jgi:hypothetical protein
MGKACHGVLFPSVFKGRSGPKPGFARDFKARLALPVATELHLGSALPMIQAEMIAQPRSFSNLGPEQAARGKD